MVSKKALTAASLAALMAGTNVASAGELSNGVFSESQENTVVSMTDQEMQTTQGQFVCGGMCVISLAAAGGGLLTAGLFLGEQAHQKWG
jgi:ribosomal protein S4E